MPAAVKRAVVLGIIARVERFTLPAAHRPDALSSLLSLLLVQSGFPKALLRSWILSQCRGLRSWLKEAWELVDI